MMVVFGLLMTGACASGLKLYERFEPTNQTHMVLYTDFVRGQSFTIGCTGDNERVFLAKISLYGYMDMSDAGFLEVRLVKVYENGLPTESVLSEGRIPIGNIPGEGADWFDVPMSLVVLQPSTKYAMLFRITNESSSVHLYFRANEQMIGLYPGGEFLYYQGGIWTHDETVDYRFRIWGRYPWVSVIDSVKT